MIIIPVQKYHFKFKVTKKITLPKYSGSILRGHFGNQLRKSVCVTKQENCKNCPLIKRCLYGKLFENISNETLIHPYVIEPLNYNTITLENDKIFSFSTILMGEICNDLSLIIYIWETIFKIGFKHRDNIGTAQLLNVQLDSGEIIYDKLVDEPSIVEHNKFIKIVKNSNLELKVNLITPLRLQSTNQYGKSIILNEENFNIKDFIKAILRKVKIINDFLKIEFKIPELTELSDIIIKSSTLKFTSTRRFSRRQNVEMDFYGLLGEFILYGNSLSLLSELLLICEYIHIGKSTTFGFGKYQLIYDKFN